MNIRSRKGLSDQSGSIAIIVGIAIFVLLGLSALALDIAHMVTVKSQLQKAADAGSLAGARGLWPLVQPVKNPTTINPDCAAAFLAAQLTTLRNQVDGSNLAADGEITIQVGLWNYKTKTFTPGCTTNSNAVRVSTRRDGVVMLFAKVFGISTTNLSATATAVQDFASAMAGGAIPITLDKKVAQPTEPPTIIKVHMTPDNTDNAGWFVVPPDSAAAATLKAYINKKVCPPLKIGDLINLQNGADASVISALKDEFDTYHAADGYWDTCIPLVETAKFGQTEPIVGFVAFRITKIVNTTDDKRVEGTVLQLIDSPAAMPGPAGKEYGGVLAPPKAVQ